MFRGYTESIILLHMSVQRANTVYGYLYNVPCGVIHNFRVLNDLQMFGSSPTPSPSPACKLSLFLNLRVCRRAGRLLTGEGGGVGDEPNHTTARKHGPLYIIQYSLVIILKMHGQANLIISLQS